MGLTRPDLKSWREANALVEDAEELRAHARKDGYLFFRGLLPRERVLSLRKDFVTILQKHGWLDEGVDPMEARSSQEARLERTPAFWPVFYDYWVLQSYHALPHAAPIMKVFELLFGEQVLLHPRHGSRVIFPQTQEHSTPPHQDYIYIQGTTETWSVWIPLGDCPIELGSLAIMPGTNTGKIYPVRPMKGAGGFGIDEQYLDGEWHASDFECGDVLMFHSQTIHRSLDNLTKDRIRLSVDYRYQPLSHPIVVDGLEPTFATENGLTWEKVYENWPTDDYKYYWRSMNVKTGSRDPGLINFEEGFEPQARK